MPYPRTIENALAKALGDQYLVEIIMSMSSESEHKERYSWCIDEIKNNLRTKWILANLETFGPSTSLESEEHEITGLTKTGYVLARLEPVSTDYFFFKFKGYEGRVKVNINQISLLRQMYEPSMKHMRDVIRKNNLPVCLTKGMSYERPEYAEYEEIEITSAVQSLFT